MSSRIPVVLLTGFLGSGKTTLLRRSLGDARLSRAAVLINEFGEIGLDHLLIREVRGSTIVLENGCVCCQLQGDLRQSLRALIDDRGRADAAAGFDRIIIETTGLADPAPILRAIELDPMLRHQLRLDVCVTTVDAMHAMSQLADFPEIVSQIAAADRLVVTKGDLVSSEALSDVTSRLAEVNPTARVLDGNAPDFDPVALLLGGLFGDGSRAELRRWFRGVATDAGDGARRLGAGNGVSSFSLRIAGTVDWTAFGVWLSALLHRHGSNVLRVKGLLNVPDAQGPIVLHGVQNMIHPPVHLDEWPDSDHASRLVFIVQDLEPERIRRSLLLFLSAAQGQKVDVEAA
jgi:G3E family GTPase